VANAYGIELHVSEQPIGAIVGEALLAVFAVGLVGRPDGLDGVLKKNVSAEPELRHLSDELVNLYSTPIPPPAR
jgi:hypothetical protein